MAGTFDEDDLSLDTDLDHPVDNSKIWVNRPYDEALEVKGEEVSSGSMSPAEAASSMYNQLSMYSKSKPKPSHLKPIMTSSMFQNHLKPISNTDLDPEFVRKIININVQEMSKEELEGYLDLDDSQPSDYEDDVLPDYSDKLATPYQPELYAKLDASAEIKSLFRYITSFAPEPIEMRFHLAPFIPTYQPAIHDSYSFISIPRPDGKKDLLGLTNLDEPKTYQTDPTLLKLSMRMKSCEVGSTKEEVLKSIPHDVKQIESWMESIAGINRLKPPPKVHYTRNMPSIDTLMQEWPAPVEELLQEAQLPTAELDCSLMQFVDLTCGLVDIPIYKSRVQSLHVLFSLLLEFKTSQHFKSCLMDKAGNES